MKSKMIMPTKWEKAGAGSSGQREHFERVSFRLVAREFERAFDEVFCAKRPWLRENKTSGAFGFGRQLKEKAA